MSTPFASHALDYFGHGWYPIPCCWDDGKGRCACGRRDGQTGESKPHEGRDVGKAPVVAYKTLFKAPPTREQVKGWASRRPHANIALLLEPSRLVVIDVDSEDAEREAERLGLPLGPRVRTRHGFHAYTRRPAGCPVRRATRQGASSKIDVLGHGYVVAPPSRHASGHDYAFTVPPSEHPLDETPGWAVDVLRAAADPLEDVPPVALPEDIDAAELASLPVSERIKRIILAGHDQDRYGSASESRWAVLQALIVAGLDDATIAGVLLDERHGISAKPRREGRRWLAHELARARAKSRVLVIA